MSGIAVNYKNIHSGDDFKNNYKDFPMGEMNNWKFIDLSSPQEITNTFKNSKKYFSHGESYTKIPDLKEMDKSSLQAQLIVGSAIFIFGEMAGRMIIYGAIGTVSGVVLGAAIGAVVGGVPTGGIGLVPGAAVGAAVGGIVVGYTGIVVGAIHGEWTGLDKALLLYEDLKILKNTEAGINQKMRKTIKIAHKFFVKYLKDMGKKELAGKIFCPISKDIMIIPVKTDCGHVFELMELTKHFKTSKTRNCPVCREVIKKADFDFPTCKVIKDVIKDALNYLKSAAGEQKLLLIQKHFKERKFTNLNSISRKKIDKGEPISLAEARTLYYMLEEYSKNHERISEYIKNTLGQMIMENHRKDKIDDEQFMQMSKKLKNEF